MMTWAAAHRTAGETRRQKAAGRMRPWLIVALIAAAGVAVMAATEGVPEATPDRAAARSILAHTNGIRADAGLTPLAYDAALARAAERHAREIAATDRLDHIGAGGTTPDARAEAQGYAGWRVVAENLSSSAGPPDATAIVAAWMASETHRANILAPDLRDAGAACYVAGDPARAWCALELGAR